MTSPQTPDLSFYRNLLHKNKNPSTLPLANSQSTNQNTKSNPAQKNIEEDQDSSQTPESDLYSQYYPQSQLEESQIAPWMYKPLPEEDILQWSAPSRPFKKRNKKYYSTVAIIALLISLILGFAGQLAAITVVIAVSFLAYVLSVIPPQNVSYKITTWGVRIENALYYWEELGRFWFNEKYKEKILNIECARFPNRLTILLGEQDQDLVSVILSEVLLNQKPEPTLYEKAAAWLQEKIPLDIEE